MVFASSLQTILASAVCVALLVAPAAATCSWTVDGKNFDYSSLTSSTKDYECASPGCSSDGATYYLNWCQNEVFPCDGKTTPVCQLTSDSHYFSCGTLATVSAEAIDGDTSKGLIVTYDGGDKCHEGTAQETSRRSKIHCECVEGSTKGLYEGDDDPLESCHYIFKFEHGTCCAGSAPAPPSPSPAKDDEKKGFSFVYFLGWFFNILGFMATIVYIVVGILVKVIFLKGRGFNIIPNKSLWFDLPFLIKDGGVFVYCYTIGLLVKLIMSKTGKKKSAGYEQF